MSPSHSSGFSSPFRFGILDVGHSIMPSILNEGKEGKLRDIRGQERPPAAGWNVLQPSPASFLTYVSRLSSTLSLVTRVINRPPSSS
jgi:hypothetical protein